MLLTWQQATTKLTKRQHGEKKKKCLLLSSHLFSCCCAAALASFSLTGFWTCTSLRCCNRNQEKRLTKKRKILPSSWTVLTSDSLSLSSSSSSCTLTPFSLCACVQLYFTCSVTAGYFHLTRWMRMHISLHPLIGQWQREQVAGEQSHPAVWLSLPPVVLQKARESSVKLFLFFLLFLLLAVSLFKGNSSEIPSPVTFFFL